MLNLLPQNNILIPDSTIASDVIEFVNSYIENNACKELSIDISSMNVIDACYVRTICSTKHYIKYPDGKISWKLSSGLVDDFCKDLNLGNCYSF